MVRGLSGLIFEPVGKDYLAACRGARQGHCASRARVRRSPLEARVLEALGARLVDPANSAASAAEWNRLAAEASAGAAGLRHELQAVERRIGNLLDALAEGMRTAGVQGRPEELEAGHSALRAALDAAPPTAPRLHPNITQAYRSRVARLRELLAGCWPAATAPRRSRRPGR